MITATLRHAGVLLAAGLVLTLGPVRADTNPLQEARACTTEPARLARLACFDRVFHTPVSQVNMRFNSALSRPADWLVAYAQEARRQPQDGVLYQHARAGHLLTIAALGALPPRPLLAVQCQNNITELMLMLPQPLDRERVKLSFNSTGGHQLQLWRVRDEGLVLSGGRGLPAIRTIKGLIGLRQVQLASKESRLDGLVFDLTGLQATLAPLRQACGW